MERQQQVVNNSCESKKDYQKEEEPAREEEGTLRNMTTTPSSSPKPPPPPPPQPIISMGTPIGATPPGTTTTTTTTTTMASPDDVVASLCSILDIMTYNNNDDDCNNSNSNNNHDNDSIGAAANNNDAAVIITSSVSGVVDTTDGVNTTTTTTATTSTNKVDGGGTIISVSDDDENYENLDLNFDDLYSDAEVEEYFVQQQQQQNQQQQQSSLVVPYYQRPSSTTDSSIASFASNTSNSNDLNVDDNDYYRLLSIMSTTENNATAISSTGGSSSNNNIMATLLLPTNNDDDHYDDNDDSRIYATTIASSSMMAGDNDDDDDRRNNFSQSGIVDASVVGTNKEQRIMDNDENEYPTPPQLQDETYILGTLIVRVVAARGLASAQECNISSNTNNRSMHDNNNRYHRSSNNNNNNNKSGGGIGGGLSFLFGGGGGGGKDRDSRNKNVAGTNPYASVRFSTITSSGNRLLNQQQVQRTSTVFNTCQPVWPRGENMYMDVSHPMPSSINNNKKSASPPKTTADENNDDPTAVTAVSSSESSSSASLSSDTADNDVPRHPGDPPLKSASIAAKAKAAAKERFLSSDMTESNISTTDKQPPSSSSASSSTAAAAILSPILSCALFHSPNRSSGKNKKLSYDDDDDSCDDMVKKKKNNTGGNPTRGDSDDWFLGMASLDLTPLLTGKLSIIDEWIPLSGGAASGVPQVAGTTSTRQQQQQQQQQYSQQRSTSASSLPSVRIVCEYEPTDTSPQKGDYVQFTQFCHPSDLYPLMIPNRNNTMYKVEEVYNDGSYNNENYVLISNQTSGDGWVSTFLVNRYMLIMCKERLPTVIEYCYDELSTHAERIAHSALAHAIQETVHERVPERGLIPVGAQIVQEAVSTVLHRWLQDENCIKKVVDDLNYVTNWDGKHTIGGGITASGTDIDTNHTNIDTADYNAGGGDRNNNVSNNNASNAIPDRDTMSILEHDLNSKQFSTPASSMLGTIVPNMPSCPITGVPMRDPVVAADGHTYERTAIARWLQTNDRSPLTGSRLAHKNLVPNYMLLSSLQELASAEAARTSSTSLKAPPGASQSGSINTVVAAACVDDASALNERIVPQKDSVVTLPSLTRIANDNNETNENLIDGNSDNSTNKQQSRLVQRAMPRSNSNDEDDEEDKATTEVNIDD